MSGMRNWFHTVSNSELPRLFAEVFRVLKRNRHFYLFCDEITADVIKEQQGITSSRDSDGARSCKSGFRYWRELIWGKTTLDGTKIYGGMGYHYRSATERILFFEKGKRRLNDLGIPDILLAPRPQHRGPAVKPINIVTTLVTQSTDPGEVVVDPFAGSGVVAQAAIDTGRHFWINDLDDSYLLPAVRERVHRELPTKALGVPRTSDPDEFLERFLSDMAAGKTLHPDIVHDRDMLDLGSDEGMMLADKLLATRPLERSSLFRRFLRSSAWLKVARARAHNEPDFKSDETAWSWLKWADG